MRLRASTATNLFTYCAIAFLITSCAPAAEESNPPTAIGYRTTMDQSMLLTPDTLEVHTEQADTQGETTIDIQPEMRYQTMDGFGFTLNGGSALHLQKMTPPARKQLLKELFAPEGDGARISYLRVSIGASDLDEFTWSYDDRPAGVTDEDLEHFSLAYDTLYLIPTLKEILALNPDLKIMGSPWSPPAWMKDNEDTRGGSLRPEYFLVYAHYLVKYLQAMGESGIPIDAITVQNEPLHPGNNPSLLMLAEDQGVFIRDHLGPAFRENGINTKIIIYDHNADRPDYPISILDDPEAAQYVDGSAFHLYGGTIDALSTVHDAHPDKHLYFTEQWIGAPANFAGDFSWHVENLIIGAPRHWCKTVLEWNLAADENQMPHTDRGGCDRCLGAITIQGDSVSRNPAYYIIAQAARFVPPGSVRVASDLPEGIPNVAYQIPTGETVIILQNKQEEPTRLRLKRGSDAVSCSLSGREVLTLVWPSDLQ